MRSAIGSALALTVWLATSASAQVKLESRFTPGMVTETHGVKVHQVLSVVGQDFESNADSQVTTRVTTDAPAPDGAVRVHEKTTAITSKISLPGGAKVEYDSSKPDVKNDDPMLQGIVDSFSASKDAEIVQVFDQKKQLTAVEGTDKILERASPAAAAVLKSAYRLESLQRDAKQGMERIPDMPVKKGDRWKRTEVQSIGAGQRLTYDTFYEYAGTVEKSGKTYDKITVFQESVKYSLDDDSPLPVKVSGSDLKIDSSSGSFLFDRDRGEIVEYSSSVHITGSLTLSVNGMEIPGKLDLSMDVSTLRK